MAPVSYEDLGRMTDEELVAWSQEAIRRVQMHPRRLPGRPRPRPFDVGRAVRLSRVGRRPFEVAARAEWDSRRIAEQRVARARAQRAWRLAEGRRQWKRAQFAAEMRAWSGEALTEGRGGLVRYGRDVGEAVRLQAPPGYRLAPRFSAEFPGLVRMGERAAPLMRRLAPAARVVGRVAAPVGLALDIYEIGRTSAMAVSWRRAEAEAHESGIQAARLTARRAEMLEASRGRRLAAAVAELEPETAAWIAEHASPGWFGPDPWREPVPRALPMGERAAYLGGWAAGPGERRLGGVTPAMLQVMLERRRREPVEETERRAGLAEALAIAPWAESREDILREIARGLQELGLLDKPLDAHR